MTTGNHVALDTVMTFETVREQMINFTPRAFAKRVESFYKDNQNYACEIHIGPIDEWGEYLETSKPEEMTLELGDVAHYLLLLADYYGTGLTGINPDKSYDGRKYLHRIAGIYKKLARAGVNSAYGLDGRHPGIAKEINDCIVGGLSMVAARCVNHCISFDTLMTKNIKKLEKRYN